MEWYFYVLFTIIFLVVGWLSTSGVKSQWIRMGDVLLFGPILIISATQVPQIWLKVSLIAFGASTMSYNARNWLQHTKK